MQTKQQIKQLLAIAGVEPNKRLGQHFLIDMNLMNLLLKSASVTGNDIVLEVGTGTGSLTEELVKRAGAVIAVEYDSSLTQITSNRIKSRANFAIINADILENKNAINQAVISKLRKAQSEIFGKVLLVSNLPYNVASAVMMNLITGPVVADIMVVTVQKEVADRMVAEPGSDNYGVLSIFMAAMGQVKLIRKLSPKVFWPKPQVESAIIRFDRSEKKVKQILSIKLFKQVVNLFMGHRRKMIKACIKFAEDDLSQIHHWHNILEHTFVEPHHRPEELSASDYVAISNLCYESLE